MLLRDFWILDMDGYYKFDEMSQRILNKWQAYLEGELIGHSLSTEMQVHLDKDGNGKTNIFKTTPRLDNDVKFGVYKRNDK